jgi:hypothetical protein
MHHSLLTIILVVTPLECRESERHAVGEMAAYERRSL